MALFVQPSSIKHNDTKSSQVEQLNTITLTSDIENKLEAYNLAVEQNNLVALTELRDSIAKFCQDVQILGLVMDYAMKASLQVTQELIRQVTPKEIPTICRAVLSAYLSDHLRNDPQEGPKLKEFIKNFCFSPELRELAKQFVKDISLDPITTITLLENLLSRKG